MEIAKETKDSLTKWGVRVGIIAGVFAVLTAISTFWLWAEFPLPASAMNVERLEKQQAQTAIEVYNSKAKRNRKELRELKREKRRLEREEPNAIRAQEDIDDAIDEIEEIEKKLNKRLRKFEDRLIELGE